jgi:hypothetical protein
MPYFKEGIVGLVGYGSGLLNYPGFLCVFVCVCFFFIRNIQSSLCVWYFRLLLAS